MTFRTRGWARLAALALVPCGFVAGGTAKTGSADAAPAVHVPQAGMHRSMGVRTFPASALAGLGAAGRKAVNQCNSTHGTHRHPAAWCSTKARWMS